MAVTGMAGTTPASSTVTAAAASRPRIRPSSASRCATLWTRAPSAIDLTDACIIDNYELPKLYNKTHYCVSCAVHRKTVRPRSKITRGERANPRALLMEKYRKQAAGGDAAAAAGGPAK